MQCQKCNGRVAGVTGKCGDLFSMTLDGVDAECRYVPYDIGLGGGDYICFDICLDCGQVQGTWPVEFELIPFDGESEHDEGCCGFGSFCTCEQRRKSR